MFSTASVDNDDLSSWNCAADLGVPWWHKDCSIAQLTGHYGPYPTIGSAAGITWVKNLGDAAFAKYATMMVRPI
jgi:hypothetical protein